MLTDRLTILIVPFATLILWATGAQMTDSIQKTLLVGVAMTVGAVVLLRFLAASYFVWKDDLAEKMALKAELSDPERRDEIALRQYAIEIRKKLSTALGKLTTYAGYEPNHVLGKMPDVEKTIEEVDSLINQLSYDFPLRVSAIRLRQECTDIITKRKKLEPHFWEQRKLTFEILHKQYKIADFMTLMEIYILLEDSGILLADSDDSAVQDLKSVMRNLGERYHDEEVKSEIRKSIKAASRVKPVA